MRHVEIAVSQLGVEEVPRGSNKGPDVEKYLASVGLSGGYAWCMAFVYWCHKEAGINGYLVKTGGVLRQWNEVAPSLKHTTPKAGDIFIMDFGHGKGHTGIVESVVGSLLHTIEANTNSDGSRDGYMVCRRTREISKCKGFIRV